MIKVIIVRSTLGLALALVAAPALAQDDHRSFDTPQAAVDALVGALDKGDTAAVASLLGPGSEWLLDSGDPVQDATDRQHFLERYRARHALVADGKGRQTLVVGEDDWPFPVPVVQRSGRWALDGDAGVDELIYRRIGRNELGAIAACRGFVDAQRDYAADGHDGDPAGIYAMKLLSDEGRQNGLYWPTAEGESPSPAGPFVAAAAGEGYRRTNTAYHGYQYRMLYHQGRSAKGGAKEYFKVGLLTGGYALVAWPAEYGISGIMTFIVNKDNVVYQRDLGENTDAKVASMSSFDPDRAWKAVK